MDVWLYLLTSGCSILNDEDAGSLLTQFTDGVDGGGGSVSVRSKYKGGN